MGFHVVTSTVFDFEAFAQRSLRDEGPRHTLYQISEFLHATIHQPDPNTVTPLDKALSKLVGQPAHWALARKLAGQLTSDDVVYCAGEDVGLPLAMLLRLKPRRPRLAMFVMAPERFRTRNLIKKLKLSKTIQLFTVTDTYKADYLKRLSHLTDLQLVA